MTIIIFLSSLLGAMAITAPDGSGHHYYDLGAQLDLNFTVALRLPMVFSVGAAGLLLRNLWQAVTGKLAEKDLIQVRESEDKVELAKLNDQEAADSIGAPNERRKDERRKEVERV